MKYLLISLLLLSACGKGSNSVIPAPSIPVSPAASVPVSAPSGDTTPPADSNQPAVSDPSEPIQTPATPQPQTCTFSPSGTYTVSVGQLWQANINGTVTCNGTNLDFAALVQGTLNSWCANSMSQISQTCEAFPIAILSQNGQTCVKIQVDTSPTWQSSNGFVNQQEVLCLTNQ